MHLYIITGLISLAINVILIHWLQDTYGYNMVGIPGAMLGFVIWFVFYQIAKRQI